MQPLDPIEKVAAQVFGSKDGAKTLVLVNGFGETQEVWADVVARLPPDLRIVTFDHAGTGRASAAAFSQHRYLNLGPYARDLGDLAQALELRDAVIVGHSVGGMIGLLAAVDRPSAFGKLVLIGSSPRYLDEPGYRGGFTEADLQQVYRSLMHDYAKWAEAYAPIVMGNADRPQLAEHFASMLKRIDPKHALSALCAIFQSDHRDDLAKVRQPTLILQTKHDPAVPIEVARYLNAHIAGSQLVIVKAEGHFPHVSAPSEIVEALRAFVHS